MLTKRSLRLRRVADKLDWPQNLWMGVSVENAAALSRVDHLRDVPAAVRFLSCEPLLGPLDGIDLDGIHWVIAGGESGPELPPSRRHWVRGIRDDCRDAERRVLLQAVGRPNTEGARPRTRRPTLGRDAYGCLRSTRVPHGRDRWQQRFAALGLVHEHLAELVCLEQPRS